MLDRVKRSISNYQKQQKRQLKTEDKLLWLPDHISNHILDLQFQCETEQLNKQKIDRLVEFYSKAVEFYNQRGNYKYKIYQKRMQLFLTKPRIQQILKGRTAKMIIAQEKTKSQLKNAQQCSKKQVEQIISEHQKNSHQIYKRMRQDLKKQQRDLEQRIRKKRTNSNKSTKTNQNLDEQFEHGKIGERMDIKLLLNGINQRSKKVFF